MLEAKVNVLTSWIETPGLVSLEAAYASCNIVVSDKGSVKEYFGNYAYYCNPADSNSIKKAVLKAFTSEYDIEFKKHIQKNFTWKSTAEQTYNVYKKYLKKDEA